MYQMPAIHNTRLINLTKDFINYVIVHYSNHHVDSNENEVTCTTTYAHALGPDYWECRIREAYGLYMLGGVHPTQMPVLCQVCMHIPPQPAKPPQKRHDCKLRALWHERLGHPGITAMERLNREDLCLGIPISLLPCDNCETHCDSCVRGKQCRPTFPTSTREPERVMHRIHADLVGQLPTPGTGGERYFVTVVDELSRFVDVLPVHL